MMRRLAERPGLVFGLVFAWKVLLLVFTAQPVPANDSFFYDGAVVNYLLHGKYVNPSLAEVLPISGNEVFSAYPPLYHLVLFGWMSLFGTNESFSEPRARTTNTKPPCLICPRMF